MNTAASPSVTAPSPMSSMYWWFCTWVFGVLVGSLALGVFHAPSRPDDPVGVGDVIAAPIGVLGLSLLGLWSAYLAGMWLASQRTGTGNFVDDYGIRFAPIDLIGIPIGIVGQVVLVRVIYAPLQSLWPDTFDSDRLADTARDLVDRADGATLFLLIGLVAVGAPIVEELFFRGMLQRPLLDAARVDKHRWVVVVGVAAIFAVIHFRPVEFPGLFAIGLVFGVCAWRTGRLGMAILAHGAFNATGLLSVM